MSDALEAGGLIFLAAAGFTVSITLGLAVIGVGLLLLGFALDRKDAE